MKSFFNQAPDNIPPVLWRVFCAIVICACLCFILIAFFDRPVALRMHALGFSRSHWLQDALGLPYVFAILTPIVYVYYVIRWAYQEKTYFDRFLLLCANSFLITYYFKISLKYFFGRQSVSPYLHSHIYAFKMFTGDGSSNAFPSGHTSLTVTIMACIWIAYPKLRWVAVLIAAFEMIGLVMTNSHFIADVVAGAFLGSIVAYLVARISEFGRE